MNIVSYRRPSYKGATISELWIDGEETCYILEDEVREIEGKPVSEWKVPRETAIPAGCYKITLENSNRFGPDTITLNNVEGFKYIRMHGGNKADDTEGCLITGMKVTDHEIVPGTSQPALKKVKEKVKQAIEQGEDVYITILNPKDYRPK